MHNLRGHTVTHIVARSGSMSLAPTRCQMLPKEAIWGGRSNFSLTSKRTSNPPHKEQSTGNEKSGSIAEDIGDKAAK